MSLTAAPAPAARFIPGWPTLAPADLLRPRNRAPLWPFRDADALWIYRATNAIHQLFKALPLATDDVVLVPEWHSGNEVWAMRAAGARLVFYPISADRQPDLQALKALFLRHRPRVLYVIHYLGWPQPLDELRTLCADDGALLIEDCALSMFGRHRGAPLGSVGDHAIYCLYKTLAAPNGGLLVQNRGRLPALERLALRRCGTVSVAGRTIELLLESLRARAPALGRAVLDAKHAVGSGLTALRIERDRIGNIGFAPDSVDLDISPLSRRLALAADGEGIRRRRRENYAYLAGCLPARAPLLERTLDDDVCPLFLPLRVRDKAGLARRLAARGVTALEFWNTGDGEAARGESGVTRDLRAQLLGLPIHQQLGRADLDHIAGCMDELMEHC